MSETSSDRRVTSWAANYLHLRSDDNFLRVFLVLMHLWNIDPRSAEQLLAAPSGTYGTWVAGPAHLRAEQRERISHLAAIYFDVERIFGGEVTARRPITYDWIKLPNKAFDNKSALAVLCNGTLEDFVRVRDHLEEGIGWV